jgi:hypothetical protein
MLLPVYDFVKWIVIYKPFLSQATYLFISEQMNNLYNLPYYLV